MGGSHSPQFQDLEHDGAESAEKFTRSELILASFLDPEQKWRRKHEEWTRDEVLPIGRLVERLGRGQEYPDKEHPQRDKHAPLALIHGHA
jgi:hypothetical protein